MSAADLRLRIAGLELKNPFMPASGTFGSGLEYAAFGDLSKLGAIVTKGVSLEPRPGNRPPRICEVRGGMLNSIGLENGGFPAFREILARLDGVGTKVIVNFFGNTTGEYIELARLLNAEPVVDALEMNISCPNIKEGGMCFGTDAALVRRLVADVKTVAAKPLFVKLTPNTGDITAIAAAAEAGGADALVVANTYTGMAIDVRSRRPMLSNVFGGLSGPAVKPLSLYAVYRCACSVKIPVVGCGGIGSVTDALEYIIAGATAVQVGTANFTNPRILWELIDGLDRHLAGEGTSLAGLTGSLKT